MYMRKDQIFTWNGDRGKNTGTITIIACDVDDARRRMSNTLRDMKAREPDRVETTDKVRIVRLERTGGGCE